MVERSTLEADRRKVWELIKKIGIALLVTRGTDAKLHARPLAASQKTFDGRLWFMTQDRSPKLAELLRDQTVLVAYADLKAQSYVCVSGTAEIVTDPEKTKDVWTEGQRLFFPQGPQESDIRLICVTVESAEYWDRPSTPFTYVYHYLKTLVTGRAAAMIGANKVVYF